MLYKTIWQHFVIRKKSRSRNCDIDLKKSCNSKKNSECEMWCKTFWGQNVILRKKFSSQKYDIK